MELPADFVTPPSEFSLCTFWFWNDDLDEAEIDRQMADFQAHGVQAFVIHPRVGLPRAIAWMSDRMLHFVRYAVERAASRGMWVVLYDEGMYPSGSSSGQVVAENPDYRCRGLVRRPVGTGNGRLDEEVLLRTEQWEVVDRPIDSVIRGLHYVGEGPEEDSPPAADLLNPSAVACFIRKVYDRYASVLGDHFGTTVKGIFTDEPSLLGRPRESRAIPGTRGIVGHVERLTGVDLGLRLLELWDAGSEARKIYDRAIAELLGESYYSQLSAWCRENGIALMGHPEPPDDLGVLRHFDVPGQDLVWRWVLPGPTAVEGPQSTQAKCAASAMKHMGKRRNSNECAGAYGHELTLEEFKWLIDWCAVRGTNLFFPHAFYYSIRGPRKDERPPDVGPNSPWWDGFEQFARYCARLCWLNTDSEHVCAVAILENAEGAPWRAAKACFQYQIDFDYLRRADLETWCSRYRLVIHDGQADHAPPLTAPFNNGPEIVERAGRTIDVEQHPDLRVRNVRKGRLDAFLVHNEGAEPLDLRLPGDFVRVSPWDLNQSQSNGRLCLGAFELCLLLRPVGY